MDNQTLGKNLARLRGEMSQTHLAEAMKKRGWKWSQTTVWSVERGDRPLKVTEVFDLAEILGVHAYQIMEEPPETDLAKRLEQDKRRLVLVSQEAASRIKEWFRAREEIWNPENATPDVISELGKRYWEYREFFSRDFTMKMILWVGARDYALERFAGEDRKAIINGGENAPAAWPGLIGFIKEETGIDISGIKDVYSEEG